MALRPDWLEAILPRFRELTGERLDALRRARAAARSAADPREAVRAIGTLAHTVAGTAASFGFDRLGACARRVEQACQGPGADDPQAARAVLGRIAADLDALEDAMEQSLRPAAATPGSWPRAAGGA